MLFPRIATSAPARTAALCRIATIVAAAAVSLSAQSFAPQVLRVLNGAAQQRTAEPVICGFPVCATESVYNTALFRVRNPAGVVVPAQFRALTRWSGERTDATKKLRWVQAAFLADVSPGGVADYSVEYGVAGPPGTLVVIPGSSSIEVRNGVGGIFVIKSTQFFAPFKVVEINGQTLLNSGLGNGAIEMTSQTGAAITAVPTSTIVEQSGSVLCVIRQVGTLGALRYTCRWTFFAGRFDVAIDFRLENPNAYGLFTSAIPEGQVYFDKLWLMQPFAGTGATVTSALGSYAPTAAAPWELTQNFAWTSNVTDVGAGMQFQEKLGTTTTGAGNKYEGAFDFKSSAGGVTIGSDRFWQSFPKALKASATQVRIGLWPEWGSGPHFGGQYVSPSTATSTDPLAANNYRFEGGRWKSHRTVWDFRAAGTRTPAEVAAFAERVQSPLAAAPEPERVRKSKATGHLFVESKPWNDVSLTRFDQFGAMTSDDSAADFVQNFGKIGLPGFLNRGSTYGGTQTFGWENDGDVPWADGYCSGHYDWAGSVLMNFLRTRSYSSFRMGRSLASYRRDYGQNHSTNTAEAWRGAQFYEKGWWHGNFTLGQNSHNWALGLGLLYVTTGDEGAREALIENMNFVLRDPPALWSGLWGDRILGWAVDALVDGWSFVGSTAYRTAATAGATRYQVLELASGGQGYNLNLMTTPPSSKPWFASIAARAIARQAMATGATTHHALLGRMRNHLAGPVLTRSTGPQTARTMPSTVDQWSPTSGGVFPSLHLVWAQVDALSYITVATGNMSDYALTKELFDVLVRYWQLPVGSTAQNMTNSASFSSITMRAIQYPTSESKVVGNVLQWGLSHVALRAMIEGY